MKPALPSVLVEHLHGGERHIFEVTARAAELLEQVMSHGDDVAADGVGLADIEDLAGLAQSSSSAGKGFKISSACRMSGTGSRPVSAILPANTETMAPRLDWRASATVCTWLSERTAVTLSRSPSLAKRADQRGPQLVPAVSVTGIFT